MKGSGFESFHSLSDVDGAGDGLEDGGHEVLERAQVVANRPELKAVQSLKICASSLGLSRNHHFPTHDG